MFGAKAEQIKRRFWLRVVTPRDVKGEYWLEAIPRTMQDAQNFIAMKIIISEDDFLPKAMLMFHPNKARTTYLFNSRETNWIKNPFARSPFVPVCPLVTGRKLIPLRNGQRPWVQPDSRSGGPCKCGRHSHRVDRRKTRAVDKRFADQLANGRMLLSRSLASQR